MSQALHFETDVDTDRPLLGLLRPHLRDHPVLLAVGALAAIASPVAGLLPIYLVEIVIDGILLENAPFAFPFIPPEWLPDGALSRILFVAGAMVVLALVGAATAWLGTWCWGCVSQEVQHAIRTETFTALQSIDLGFFEAEQTGQLVNILNDDVNQLNRLLERSTAQAVEIAARFVAIVALLLLLHWQLALVLVGVIPVLALTARTFVRRLAPKHREVRQLVGALNARLHNVIAGMATVKAYTREPVEADAVADVSRAVFARRWAVIRMRAAFYPAMTTVQWVGFAAILALGGAWILNGPPPGFSRPLRVGTLVSFLLFSQQFTEPLVHGAQLVDEFYDGQASARRIVALQDRAEASSPSGRRSPDDALDGTIEVDDLSFGYDDRDERVLEDISFTVEPGEFVAIVGPTGSGKTTIAHLLLQFYEPDGGAVRIGGYDTTALADETVRETFGVVLQDPAVFTGTIRENIQYGRPDADEVAIRRAAERAAAHEFVRDLPDGYDHHLQEGGGNLSGGQRQRLALARALISERPCLLLDEATSHVDLETEAAVQETIVHADRTTIAIGHRLSVARHADRILVLEDGQIVERGTHAELLDARGTYASLWRLHTGAALDPLAAD